MCILMYFGPGAQPIRDHLDVACENNPDGFGYAVMTGTGIVTGVGMDAARVIDEFIALRAEFPHDTAMFHARIATQGSVCMDNCHPFTVGNRSLKPQGFAEVTGEMILGHNGMLPVYPAKGDDRSDTKVFAEEIFMRRFPHLDSVKTKRRLETYLGSSKLVIMTTDPFYRQQAYIFNEKLGLWLDHDGPGDIWYSNTSYRYYRYSARSYGMSAYTGYSWPTTVGNTRSTDTWDDDDAWMDHSTRLACERCRYAIVYCKCAGTVKGVYLPYKEVKVPTAAYLFGQGGKSEPEEDDDETGTWVCLGCETVGDIDDDGMCRQCGIMFCCNEPIVACVCWDPNSGRLRTKEEREEWRDRISGFKKEMIKQLTAGPSTVEVKDDAGNVTHVYDSASANVS